MMRPYALPIFELIDTGKSDVIRTSTLAEADNSDDVVRDIWSIKKL